MQRHRGKSDAAEAGRFFNTAAATNRVGDQRLACARDEETLRTTARQPESLKRHQWGAAVSCRMSLPASRSERRFTGKNRTDTRAWSANLKLLAARFSISE